MTAEGIFRSEHPEPVETVDLTDHVDDAVALLEAFSATLALVIGRSTGGQIALDLTHRFPDKVIVLVLLEPAVFTVDSEAAARADQLRRRVLEAAAQDPFSAAEVAFREALGDETWESFPEQPKGLVAKASPAVLAEIGAKGLDLSEEPLALSIKELAGISQPTLIVPSEDSPEALRRSHHQA